MTQAPMRVLVVDDSPVVRKVLGDILTASPATELAGVASSGEVALVKIPQVKPDVVTLDIEMPGMNGLRTLSQIRQLYPKLAVIMFSTLTEHGAAETLDALALGATDYAAKPTSSEGLVSAKQQVERELIRKITALRAAAAQLPRGATGMAPSRVPIRRRIDVGAIGTSSGGPNARAEVIPALPQDLPVPVLVVQHMPAMSTRLLAKHLNGRAFLSPRGRRPVSLGSPDLRTTCSRDCHDRNGVGWRAGREGNSAGRRGSADPGCRDVGGLEHARGGGGCRLCRPGLRAWAQRTGDHSPSRGPPPTGRPRYPGSACCSHLKRRPKR
jgi:DNA-binding NarL/FixJ family response regulator